jgi:uncharacterized membrane protein YfcA
MVMCIGTFSLVTAHIEYRKKNPALERSFKTLTETEKSKLKIYNGRKYGVGLVSFIAGIIVGFAGMGISGIVGTYLTAVKKMNPKIAFSTVLAVMVITSVIGASAHLLYSFSGSLPVLLIALAIGAAIGAIVGSIASSFFKFGKLRLMQGYLIMSFGVLSLILTLLKI